MNDFLTWLEKERGELVASMCGVVIFLCGVAAIFAVGYWSAQITGGWILLAVLIAPAWVAWMFYCYITRERDQ